MKNPKISAAKLGKKRGSLSLEWRTKIGDGVRGKKQSPEAVARRTGKKRGAYKNRGRPLTLEHIKAKTKKKEKRA